MAVPARDKADTARSPTPGDTYHVRGLDSAPNVSSQRVLHVDQAGADVQQFRARGHRHPRRRVSGRRLRTSRVPEIWDALLGSTCGSTWPPQAARRGASRGGSLTGGTAFRSRKMGEIATRKAMKCTSRACGGPVAPPVAPPSPLSITCKARTPPLTWTFLSEVFTFGVDLDVRGLIGE